MQDDESEASEYPVEETVLRKEAVSAVGSSAVTIYTFIFQSKWLNDFILS